MAEQLRQVEAKMQRCDCSNCEPEAAEALWCAQASLTSSNFDRILESNLKDLTEVVNLQAPPALDITTQTRPTCINCTRDDSIYNDPILERLVSALHQAFGRLFSSTFHEATDLLPDDLFGRNLAWDVAKNVDVVHQPSDLNIILGGETIPHQHQVLFDVLNFWKASENTRTAFDSAQKRRQAAERAKKKKFVVISIEGAELARKKLAAEKKDRAQKLAQEKEARLRKQAEDKIQKEAEKTERAGPKRGKDAKHPVIAGEKPATRMNLHVLGKATQPKKRSRSNTDKENVDVANKTPVLPKRQRLTEKVRF